MCGVLVFPAASHLRLRLLLLLASSSSSSPPPPPRLLLLLLASSSSPPPPPRLLRLLATDNSHINDSHTSTTTRIYHQHIPTRIINQRLTHTHQLTHTQLLNHQPTHTSTYTHHFDTTTHTHQLYTHLLTHINNKQQLTYIINTYPHASSINDSHTHQLTHTSSINEAPPPCLGCAGGPVLVAGRRALPV